MLTLTLSCGPVINLLHEKASSTVGSLFTRLNSLIIFSSFTSFARESLERDLPNEVLAVAAEGRVLEEPRDEFVVFHLQTYIRGF